MEKKIRIAAFTGTRKGMTEAQKGAVRRLLVELQITHFEHGAAIGADEQASLVARELGLKLTARPATSPASAAMMPRRTVGPRLRHRLIETRSSSTSRTC